MDVLIVERDELIGTVLADALDQDGLTATLVPDEQEAFDLPPHDAPRVVITGMNHGHNEDMAGLHIARALRKKWPGIAVIYMGALWPVRLHRCALAVRERFLAKPVPLAKMHRARTAGGGHAPSGGIEALAFPDRAECRRRAGFAYCPVLYRITRLLPLSDGIPHYHGKSRTDGHERVLSQCSLWGRQQPANINPAKAKQSYGGTLHEVA
jgi:CheY-like chemotaxis protein